VTRTSASASPTGGRHFHRFPDGFSG